MIAVVAPPGELRDALMGHLPAGTAALEPGDPMTLARGLQGAERMFLACEDEVAAGDVVSAAEMALVYYCVSLRDVPALTGSALRSRVLDPPGSASPDEVARLAAQALRDDPPPP
ncbi:MAG TPA: hypothetical protein VF587_19730 [Solirubrobacteraceae bacterium]